MNKEQKKIFLDNIVMEENRETREERLCNNGYWKRSELEKEVFLYDIIEGTKNLIMENRYKNDEEINERETCGRKGHEKEECFKNQRCQQCGKIGHTKRICKKKEENAILKERQKVRDERKIRNLCKICGQKGHLESKCRITKEIEKEDIMMENKIKRVERNKKIN